MTDVELINAPDYVPNGLVEMHKTLSRLPEKMSFFPSDHLAALSRLIVKPEMEEVYRLLGGKYSSSDVSDFIIAVCTVEFDYSSYRESVNLAKKEMHKIAKAALKLAQLMRGSEENLIFINKSFYYPKKLEDLAEGVSNFQLSQGSPIYGHFGAALSSRQENKKTEVIRALSHRLERMYKMAITPNNNKRDVYNRSRYFLIIQIL